MGKFIAGLIIGILLVLVCAYLFLLKGGVPMNVNATSMPMERFLAHTAMTASMGKAAKDQAPIPLRARIRRIQ